MKILSCSTAYDMQFKGGVSRYNYELEEKLSAIGIKLYHPYHKTSNSYANPKEQQQVVNLDQKLFSLNWYRQYGIYMPFHTSHRIKNTKYSIHQLKSIEYDIYHPSYYSTFYLKHLKKHPLVITVHDMTHEIYPQYFKWYDDTTKTKEANLRKATHVIAVSENTKQDLLKYYNLPESKVTVTPLASNLHYDNFDEEEDYLLYIGSRNIYKNFIQTLHAIKDILISNKLKLICVGSSFNKKEYKTLTDLKLSANVSTLACTDDELAVLYSRAICLIYPSLYEGFGIPLLEAFNCGCPIICSNVSSLPEVGGKAVEFFDPYDAIDIHEKVKYIVNTPSRREELRENGRIRGKEYSWDKTAQITKSVYESII